VNLKIKKKMGKVHLFGLLEKNILVNGKMEIGQAKELMFGQMVMNTMEIFLIIISTVKAQLFGVMEINILVNGKMKI
jgi:hypothetical protein